MNYAAGKAGDPDAAFQLVTDLISPDVVEGIRLAVGSTSPILASAHALERGGVNAIPEVLADLLGLRLGWKVDSNIVQTNIVSHTGPMGFPALRDKPASLAPLNLEALIFWWMISSGREARLPTCVR